mmetsp:Transcript_42851/g.102125  ORF Transcript_42851/g.102125 Transcript_42851/m.102125 type:complete len:201 (+) Transcript_42851:994-1596(+)
MALPILSVATSFAVEEIKLMPSVVVRGTSRRRIGNLVRLSGKSLSFSRARRMTSLNSPSSSTPRCLHIRSVQSALLMVNRTTPRAPRKASSVATDLPDWYRPPMMVACCCQLAMRCRRASITGLWMTSSCGLLGSKGFMAFATAARILPSEEALNARTACVVATTRPEAETMTCQTLTSKALQWVRRGRKSSFTMLDPIN